MAPCNVLIVGTGAVGAFYASRLQLAHDTQVSLICRSNYGVVSSQGLQLRTRDFGEYQFVPASVFSSIQTAKASRKLWHYVVVTTKSLPDHSDDSALIEPLVSEVSVIVLIQNGVGIETPYRARFPHTPILSAVTVISAVQPEPGLVVQNRWTRISIGSYMNYESNALSATAIRELKNRSQISVKDFCRRLSEGGIKDAEEYDEEGLQLVRWHKLLINASMNPASILSGGTGNARMALDPELRLHLKACMDELWEAVPRIVGREFPDKMATPESILRSTERNTEGMPSMLIDWRKGAPLELEVILGNPIREARRKGIALPRLQAMYALLKMAQTRRDEDRVAVARL